MRYKNDMLLILAVVLILGVALQTLRTDLIFTLSAEGKPSGEKKAYYAVNPDKQIGEDRNSIVKDQIPYELYTSFKE